MHQDGTCNGLQHYAAMGRDYEGGGQVNLLNREVPADIYTHVANLVEAIASDLGEEVARRRGRSRRTRVEHEKNGNKAG